MNKKSVYMLLGILLVLIGFVVGLIFAFFRLYENSQGGTQPEIPLNSAESEAIQYLEDSWHFQDGEWNRKKDTVTAIRVFELTYEDAQKIGSEVFTGDLAPETYLPQALTIQTDLISRFNLEDITVVISFRGTDGKELFRVDSSGHVSTCWE